MHPTARPHARSGCLPRALSSRRCAAQRTTTRATPICVRAARRAERRTVHARAPRPAGPGPHTPTRPASARTYTPQAVTDAPLSVAHEVASDTSRAIEPTCAAMHAVFHRQSAPPAPSAAAARNTTPLRMQTSRETSAIGFLWLFSLDNCSRFRDARTQPGHQASGG